MIYSNFPKASITRKDLVHKNPKVNWIRNQYETVSEMILLKFSDI